MISFRALSCALAMLYTVSGYAQISPATEFRTEIANGYALGHSPNYLAKSFKVDQARVDALIQGEIQDRKLYATVDGTSPSITDKSSKRDWSAADSAALEILLREGRTLDRIAEHAKRGAWEIDASIRQLHDANPAWPNIGIGKTKAYVANVRRSQGQHWAFDIAVDAKSIGGKCEISTDPVQLGTRVFAVCVAGKRIAVISTHPNLYGQFVGVYDTRLNKWIDNFLARGVVPSPDGKYLAFVTYVPHSHFGCPGDCAYIYDLRRSPEDNRDIPWRYDGLSVTAGKLVLNLEENSPESLRTGAGISIETPLVWNLTSDAFWIVGDTRCDTFAWRVHPRRGKKRFEITPSNKPIASGPAKSDSVERLTWDPSSRCALRVNDFGLSLASGHTASTIVLPNDICP